MSEGRFYALCAQQPGGLLCPCERWLQAQRACETKAVETEDSICRQGQVASTAKVILSTAPDMASITLVEGGFKDQVLSPWVREIGRDAATF